MEKCILCGSADNILVKVERGYQARQCCGCGLIFTCPKPSLAELQEMYEQGHAASLDVQAQMRLSRRKILVALQDISEIRRFVNGGRLLEIGCGAGYFLQVAQSQGFTCTGIEINRVLVEYARNLGLDVIPGTLLTADIHRQRYDIVYLRYVLSHMYDPITEFERINSALKEKGYLFFETGNLPELPHRSIQRITLDLPDHLYFFSRRNVKTLLERTGFELLSSTVYSLIVYEWVRKMFEKRIRHILISSKNSFPFQSHPSWKEVLIAWITWFLVYQLGRVLPKRNQLCTVKYIARKK